MKLKWNADKLWNESLDLDLEENGVKSKVGWSLC